MNTWQKTLTWLLVLAVVLSFWQVRSMLGRANNPNYQYLAEIGELFAVIQAVQQH